MSIIERLAQYLADAIEEGELTREEVVEMIEHGEGYNWTAYRRAAEIIGPTPEE